MFNIFMDNPPLTEISAVTYTLRNEDYLAFHRRMRPLTLAFILRTAGRWLITPSLLVFVVFRSPLIAGDMTRAAGLWLVLTLLWIGCCIWLARVTILSANTNRVGAKLPRTTALHPEGLLVETVTTHVLQAWPAFQKIESDARHLYFYTSPLTAVIIPRRAFSHHDDSERFLGTARERAATAAREPLPDALGPDDAGPSVRVRYALTPDDFVAYFRLTGRWDVARSIAVAVLVSIVMIGGIGSFYRIDLLRTLPMTVGYLVLISAVTAWQVTRNWRRIAAARPATEQVVILTARGVEERTPTSRATTSWTKIGQPLETATLFVLALGPKNAFVIPKRAFGSAEEARVFFQTAQAFRQAALTGTDAPPVEQVASWPPPPRR